MKDIRNTCHGSIRIGSYSKRIGIGSKLINSADETYWAQLIYVQKQNWSYIRRIHVQRTGLKCENDCAEESTTFGIERRCMHGCPAPYKRE